MLTEHECRLLSSAADIFLEDFDPVDAVHYLEARLILTQDQAESIENKPTRLERLRDFLRYYKRRADTLEPLISYFDRAKQPQIVRYLNEENTGDMRSLQLDHRNPSNTKLRKLQLGFVPYSGQHLRRNELFDHLEDLLKRRAQLDSFLVGLCGSAGTGKTSLIADVLLESSELVDACFEHVYFVRDSNSSPDKIRQVFAELLLLLKDNAECMVPMDTGNLSKSAITKQIVDALIDRPNALIVIDDVCSVETVCWLRQLRVRCLITTRSSDLLSAANIPVDIIKVSGFNYEEAMQFVFESSEKWNATNEVHLASIKKAFQLTSGNGALLGKLCKISAGRPSRFVEYLNMICYSGYSCLNCITSYQHNSLFTTLSQSVSKMSELDKTTLSCCVILPSDEWIPIAIWTTIIPVDIAGTDSVTTLVTDQLNRLMNNGSWVEESEVDDDMPSFLVPSFITLYLMESVKLEMIQYLSKKILDAANNPELCTLQKAFFEDHQEWLAKLRKNMDSQKVPVVPAKSTVYNVSCSLM